VRAEEGGETLTVGQSWWTGSIGQLQANEKCIRERHTHTIQDTETFEGKLETSESPGENQCPSG